jgi:hypothetical protein
MWPMWCIIKYVWDNAITAQWSEVGQPWPKIGECGITSIFTRPHIFEKRTYTEEVWCAIHILDNR